MEHTHHYDTYRELCSHVRNTVAMCHALQRLQSRESEISFMQILQVTVPRFHSHVRSILLLSEGLPEEETFGEYCSMLSSYAEENPHISCLCEQLSTFYKNHLNHIFTSFAPRHLERENGEKIPS